MRDGATVHHDVPCSGCACLCDDLQVTMAEGRVVEVVRACETGLRRIFYAGADRVAAQISGREVRQSDAIREAARLLANARRPVIWGLGQTTYEAQVAAIELARLIGALIEVPGSDATLQTVGEVSCTLGEIRQRADIILIWDADPLTTHPRLIERLAPPGVGFIAVASSASATTAAAKSWLKINPGSGFDAATVLRAILYGRAVDQNDVAARTGVELVIWRSVAKQMRNARYGTLITAEKSSHSGAESLALSRLIRELNDETRWVHIALPIAANAVGAANALAAQTGFSRAVDFSMSAPHGAAPDLSRAERLIERGEADLLLVIGDDPTQHFSPATIKQLTQIPTIAIGSQASEFAPTAGVFIATACPASKLQERCSASTECHSRCVPW